MAAQVLGSVPKREASTKIRAANGLPVIDETYNYIVVADSHEEPYANILSASGLPQIGQSVAGNSALVVRTVSAERRPNATKYWDVVVEASTEVEEGSQSLSNLPQQDPTVWVPIVETKLERLEEYCIVDADGTPLQNAAGKPFDTGIVRPRYIPVWEFYQFEPMTVTDFALTARCEKVNDRQFKGFPKKTLLLNVLSSTVGFYYGNRIRLTYYQLKYNFLDWTEKRENVGFVYIDGNGNEQPFKADDQTYTDYLNASGGAWSGPGDPESDKILKFDVYGEINFEDFLRI